MPAGNTVDGAHAELVRVRARSCWSLRSLLEAGVPAERVFRLGALVAPTGVAFVALFVSAGGIGDAARERTKGRGMDVWVEASGAADVVEQMAASLAPAGMVVLVGRGPHAVALDPEHLIVRGASLHGSIGHAGSGTFGRVIDLMAAGRLDMDRIAGGTVDLEGAARLLDGAPHRESGKTLVVP